MGVGYVPSSQIPGARQSDDVPRRQRRRARAPGTLDLSTRASLGAFGETLAARFLSERGLEVMGRNVAIGSGELDLICRDGRSVVAVEVRARLTTDDPIDAVNATKRRQVASLAARLRADRVDLVGIGLHRAGVDIHWVPDAV